jgi:hypothetical protein
MPHAIHIRQTGGPEVLNWRPVRRLARELEQQDLGDPASKQIHNRRRAKQADSRTARNSHCTGNCAEVLGAR